MVFTPKDRIQVDGLNYYLTTITPTASAVEPVKPVESPRMISQSEITRLDDIYPVVEKVDENDDVNLLSKESRGIRQPSQDNSLSRLSDPATSPLHEAGTAANRYSYDAQVEGSSSDARVSTSLSRPSGVNPSPVKNKSTTKTEIEYIWIPEFFLKRSAVYNHVESLNVSDLLARKLTTQTKNVNGSLVLCYDDLYFPSLYMDDTLDIVMTDGKSSKNLVRVTENNVYEIPSKRRSLILLIKDTKGKSIHIRYTKTTMSDERTVLQVAYQPEDEFDVLTQSSSQLQGSSTNYQIIDYLTPQRDMKKTHTVNFDKLLTEDDDHTTHQNENECFYYSQNISFTEKTKEIFIFFPSDTIISDAQQNDCHFTFKSPTDQLECYGHPKFTQAKLPTLASSIPLIIPNNTFAASYHDYGDQKFGYRYIAMDSTYYPVSTPVLNDSMRKDSLFTYFNNQTDTATTIYIDLPLFDDSAYFEVYLDKDSTMKSYVQLGLIFKGATVEPLSSDTSSRCLGLGSTLGTYGLDAMSEVNSETQRWANGQKSGTVVRNISFSKGAVIGFYINKVDNCVDIYQDGELRIPSAFSLPRVFYSGLCPAFSFSPGQIVALNLGTQEFRTKAFSSADSWLKKYHAHSAQDGQFYVWDSLYKTGWNLLLENQYSKYVDISANIEDVSAYGTAVNDLLTVTKQSVIPMTISSPTTALTTSTAPPQGPPQQTMARRGETIAVTRQSTFLNPLRQSLMIPTSINLSKAIGADSALTAFNSYLPTTDVTFSDAANKLGDSLVQDNFDSCVIDILDMKASTQKRMTRNNSATVIFGLSETEQNKIKNLKFFHRLVDISLTFANHSVTTSSSSDDIHSACIISNLYRKLASSVSDTLINYIIEETEDDEEEKEYDTDNVQEALETLHECCDMEFASKVIQSAGYDKTMNTLQRLLIEMDAVPLVCYLLSQRDHECIQDGIKLGHFLLLHMNTTAQDVFYAYFSKSASKYSNVATNSLSSLVIQLKNYEDEVWGHMNSDRIKYLIDYKRLLRFIQNLCSGPHKRCQSLMIEVQPTAGYRTIVGEIINILQSEYRRFNTIPISEVDEMNARLDVVQQGMDTLLDISSGPHIINQKALLDDAYGLIETLRDWIKYTDILRLRYMNILHLPSIELLMLPSPVTWMIRQGSTDASTDTTVYYGLLDMVDELEVSAMYLLKSLIDDGINYMDGDDDLTDGEASSTDEKHEDNTDNSNNNKNDEKEDDGDNHANEHAKNSEDSSEHGEDSENEVAQYNMMKVLPRLDFTYLIQRFKVLWMSIVFNPTRSFNKYTALRSHNKSVKTKSSMYSRLVTRLVRFQETFTSDLDASFRPETVTHLSKDEKDLYIALWMSPYYSDERKETSILIAFSYFDMLTSLSDKCKDNSFISTCTHELQKLLSDMSSIWTDRDPDTGLITNSENSCFHHYYGNIEVILKKKLQRIYFPIPRSCRDQMHNPVVMSEVEDMQVSIDRNSPESKIVDFIDHTETISSVALFQQYLFTGTILGPFFHFLSSNSGLWVLITMLLTLYINFNILIYANDSNDRETEFLPSDILSNIKIAGCVHIAFSGVFLLNYLTGMGAVHVYKGFKWKEDILSDMTTVSFFSSPAGAKFFKIICQVIPNWLWAPLFYFTDYNFYYYSAFCIFSILGIVYDIAFFSFHVIDIAQRIRLLNYVLKSVFINGDQVLVTLLLGAVLMWMYSVFGVYYYGFAQYNLGSGSPFIWGNNVYNVFLQHLDFGLRNAPEFDSYGADQGVTKYIFDISYQLLIIVIMVAVITGIIIDTFGDMRASKEEIDADRNNVCMICSLSRDVFERKSVNFAKHVGTEHNPLHYIYYKMYLDEKKEEMHTTREQAYLSLLNDNNISIFPIERALCLVESVEDEDDNEVLKEVSKLEDHLKESSTILSSIQANIDTLTQRVNDLYDMSSSNNNNAANTASATTTTNASSINKK